MRYVALTYAILLLALACNPAIGFKPNCDCAAFFGSIVRGGMTDESDIDILVEFEGRKSLLDLAGLKLDLEDALERRVDLLTYRSLHPMLKDRILAEQVQIL
jgi:hypothetical protein